MHFARARQSPSKDQGGTDGGTADSTFETERCSQGIATGCASLVLPAFESRIFFNTPPPPEQGQIVCANSHMRPCVTVGDVGTVSDSGRGWGAGGPSHAALVLHMDPGCV